MNKPLVLEDWELAYLRVAVADSLKNFYPLRREAEKSGVGLDAVEMVIKNYEWLQRKLEAAAEDKE